MMNTKMTKVQALTMAVELAKAEENKELIEKLQAMLATEVNVAEKARSKRSKKSAENEGLAATLLDAMTADKEYSASEAGALIDVSTPKATALLKILVGDGLVAKIAKNAKKNVYKVV